MVIRYMHAECQAQNMLVTLGVVAGGDVQADPLRVRQIILQFCKLKKMPPEHWPALRVYFTGGLLFSIDLLHFLLRGNTSSKLFPISALVDVSALNNNISQDVP